MKAARASVRAERARRTLLALSVAGGLLALSGAAPAATGRTGVAAEAPPVATVTVTTATQNVPASFLGLSMEYTELPTYENHSVLFDRFLDLIKPRDGSPLMLRIGGDSADWTYWKTSARHAQPQVTSIGDAWMARLASLTRRHGLRVMLDVNLAVHSPTMAAALTRAALKALPKGSLAALAIGNEPERYHTQRWVEKERVSSTIRSTPRAWERNYAPSWYAEDYRAYARALLAVAPKVPLAGADDTGASQSWLQAILRLGRFGPKIITTHRYPLNPCASRISPSYPTLAHVLGEAATAGTAASVKPWLTTSRGRHLHLRVTELNSTTCGGKYGVSNTFATALWAPDALFELLRAGTPGINLHVRPARANSLFLFAGDGVAPRPELYGVAAFAAMFGPGAKLVAVRTTAARADRLKAWAVRSADGLKVLLINKGGTADRVQLTPGTAGSATAEISRLTAPRPGSTTGVTFAGQTMGPDMLWHGQKRSEKVARAPTGAYPILVDGDSAAVVSFPAGAARATARP